MPVVSSHQPPSPSQNKNENHSPLKPTIITSPLLRLRTILANMPHPITVVTLGALDAVPAQVPYAPAGVARPLRSPSSTAAERTIGPAARSVGARARDVSGFAAFVAGAARASGVAAV